MERLERDPDGAAIGEANTERIQLVEEQLERIVEEAATRSFDRPRPASRDTLDREEREIKENVLRLGSLVADQILAAIKALRNHDADAATAVIHGDSVINEVQRTITGLIARTIATQQPVARDLRFLLALDHVAYELERIGDHAASVAKQARKLAPHPPLKEYVDMPQMGELCAKLVRDVLLALVDINEVQAREVAVQDDLVD